MNEGGREGGRKEGWTLPLCTWIDSWGFALFSRHGLRCIGSSFAIICGVWGRHSRTNPAPKQPHGSLTLQGVPQ